MLLINTEPYLASAVPLDEAFRSDVLVGLASRPRTIPARWLYDERGSELFEDITRLPEYYPARTELAILRAHARAIAATVGPVGTVVEFGAGSSTKTPPLLSAVDPLVYVPVDICGDVLRKSAANLAALFPDLIIHPIEGDFSRSLSLPPPGASRRRLGFFAGSTIGNLTPREGVDLLRTFAQTLGQDAMLLIGIDRIKDVGLLVPAYDDAQGVTAQFNLNLLHRINRELNGRVPVEAFRHVARWSPAEARIEMHLQAVRDLRLDIDGQVFSISEGETIHTENSHKYGARDARLLLRAGGWTPIAEWADPENLFALHLASAAP